MSASLTSLSLSPAAAAALGLGLSLALGPLPAACLSAAHWYWTDGSFYGAAARLAPHPTAAKIALRIALAMI